MTSSHLKPCPELQASCLSRLFFHWCSRLSKTVEAGRHLTAEHLSDLHPSDKCEQVCPVFERVVHSQQQCQTLSRPSTSTVNLSAAPKNNVRHRKKPGDTGEGPQTQQCDTGQPATTPCKRGINRGLTVSIVLAFWREMSLALLLRLLFFITFWTVNPHFITFLMEHTTEPDSSVLSACSLSLSLFLILIAGAVFAEHATWVNQNLQIRMRASLMATIYQKSMNLHARARTKYSTGEITSYLSSDCDTITYHVTHINYVIFTPVNFIVVFYHLFNMLGSAAVLGVVLVLIIMPINAYITVKTRALHQTLNKFKDEKMNIFNETLFGIKVLKLCALEECFAAKIKHARENELGILSRVLRIRNFTVFSWVVSPLLINVVLFWGYLYAEGAVLIPAKTAFAVMSLMNLLRFAINQTPEMIYDAIKAGVSIERLEKFLSEDELPPKSHQNATGKISGNIELDNASFAWDKELSMTLQSINMSVEQGQLVAVVGQVGSGKTSLLSAILGEIERTNGHSAVQGQIAYVSQQAWIQSETVRNNILFGNTINEERYNTTVDACALDVDISLMSDGDDTRIGERGINLSGGQKQRVSLARAVYNDADIYLLDDPLSAVDSHVGKHIFHNVIGKKGILKEKTRVLVTHKLSYLPEVDQIIVLEDGKIAGSGSFSDLIKSQGAFAKVLKTYHSEATEEKELLRELQGVNMDYSHFTLKDWDRNVGKKLDEQTDTKSNYSKMCDTSQTNATEEDDTSVVSRTTPLEKLMYYVKAFGVWNVSGVILLYGSYYVLCMMSSILVVWWTQATGAIATNNTHTQDDIWAANTFYLTIYTGMGVAMACLVVGYSVVMNRGLVKASRELHDRMLTTILRAPMHFFEKTAIGRITTRFSKDMAVVDDDLPFSLEFWFDSAMNIIITVMIVLYSSPSLIAFILPLAYYYMDIQKYHTKIGNDLCSLESRARAPIESHFTESVAGAETIRAFRSEVSFYKTLQSKINEYHRIMFYLLSNHRCLNTHVAYISSSICAVSSLVRGIFKGTQSAALLGLSTTYSMEFGGSMGWLMILQSDVETNLQSVDRIRNITLTPKEAEWRCSKSRTACSWPEQGEVEFRHFSLRYRHDLQPVLTNISLTIRAGEKVGLVGRTGAGKSSLALSLFRLVEADSGSIWIDGINIADLGLHDLREKLSIIPQDPVLFTGTLRMNLDPEDRYSDEEITTALQHTHLTQFVSTLDGGINAECGEGGNNFSVGQRQLVCLARTLLRKSRVLIMDEATASVDMETDDLIQKTIRSEFKDCTVLTIAHRLNTVMDYDRILVLNQGEVLEFDTPEILQQRKGLFYRMTQEITYG